MPQALTSSTFWGFTINILGLLAGMLGVGFAVNSSRKLKTAQQAERQTERKFMHYMAAQEFETLATTIATIMGRIRDGEWDFVRELADDIGPSLGEARGARNRLLQSLEKDRLDVAATNVQAFIDSLPLAEREADITEDDISLMLSRCRSLVDITSEIAGRLRVESIQQSEDKK